MTASTRHRHAAFVSVALSVSLLLPRTVSCGEGLVIEAVGHSKMYPQEGEKITLRARLSNPTATPRRNLRAQFFDTAPGEKEVLVGEPIAVASLDAGKEVVVETTWEAGVNGVHQIRVEVRAADTTTSAATTLPVVTKRLYFAIAFGRAEWIPNCNVVMTAGLLPKSMSELPFRGVRLCRWKSFKHRDSAEQYAEYLAKDLDKLPDRAIMIDEIGAYDERQILDGLAGLVKFKKENPDVLTTVFIAGSLKPLQCSHLHGGADLAMLESYFSWQVPLFKSYTRYDYFDQRIKTARAYDLLHKCVLCLGIDLGPGKKDPYGQSPADLEDQFRYIRLHAPEMPGISFYGATIESVARAANELIMKYYVKPVMTVWDRDLLPSNQHPMRKEAITITTSIHNLGAMDAKDVRLRFFAQDEKGKQKAIGKELCLPVVPSGPAKNLVQFPADLVSERRVDPANGVPAGKYRVEVTWRPRKAGYYKLICRLTPRKAGYTILQGEASRKIVVLDE